MATTRATTGPDRRLAMPLAKALGARRSAKVRAAMRHTGLPPETLLDLALDLLQLASRTLAPPPIRRMAIGLGAARWRHVSAKDRSTILRRAVQARWARQRQRPRTAR